MFSTRSSAIIFVVVTKCYQQTVMIIQPRPIGANNFELTIRVTQSSTTMPIQLPQIQSRDREPSKGWLPFGRLMIIPSALAVVALIFTVSSAFDCTFVSVTRRISDAQVGYGLHHTTTQKIKIGLWTAQESWQVEKEDSKWHSEYGGDWLTESSVAEEGAQECVSWNGSELNKMPDPPIKFARVCTIAAVILGIVLVILMVCNMVYNPMCNITKEDLMPELPVVRDNFPVQISWIWIFFIGCVLMGFFTMLFLSAMASPVCSDDNVDECKLAASGILCIFAMLFWWGAAIAIWILGRERPQDTKASLVESDAVREKDDEEDISNTTSEDEEGQTKQMPNNDADPSIVSVSIVSDDSEDETNASNKQKDDDASSDDPRV